MDIKNMPLEENPREKLFREGAASLSSAELLAILIGSGTRSGSALDVAAELLNMHPSGIRFLASCVPGELQRIKGMGRARTCGILAAVELGRRIASAPVECCDRIATSGDIAMLFMERMRYYTREHFICLLLNAKGDIIEEAEVSIGDLCSSSAGPREVFNMAVRRSAASIALLHNHPSGDPMPSDMDILTTKRLIDAGELMGIPVLDHIIIGDGRFISMKQEGLI